ncbi:MAG TPA: nuclear transport factor 2 family protein [Candidatus Dormibacteraeota bacterium]|nr:nuclear transport factor 2 family protein [Candidatus Dormibacteraeota bacterium]
MAGEDNRAAVERMLNAISAGDISVMDEVFADAAVIDWPASNERLNGAENRRAVYQRTPVLPKITFRRVFGDGDLWIVEGSFNYDGDAYEGILVFEFGDGKVAHQTGYWAKPGEGPAWRAEWVEKLRS